MWPNVILSLVLAAPLPTTRPQERAVPAGLHEDLFESLRFGAQPCVCVLLKLNPVTAPGDRVERGRAELRVIEALRGPSRSTLRLPYYCQPPASDAMRFWDLNVIWSEHPAAFIGHRVFCTFLPGASDGGAGKISDCDGAAADVIPNPTDEEIDAVREAVRLHGIENEKQLIEGLSRAAVDDRPLLRQYALEATILRLLPVDAAAADAIIAARIAHQSNLPFSGIEALRFIEKVDRVRYSLGPTGRRQLAKMFCQWTARGSEEFVVRATITLSWIAAREDIGAPAGLISFDVRSALEHRMRWLEKNPEVDRATKSAAARLLEWLKARE